MDKNYLKQPGLAGIKYIPAFLWLLLLHSVVLAQPADYIRGKVVDGETGATIANASVFITNTSKGTVSDAAGRFELAHAPVGTYDLVVSCIGFETQVYTYKASQLPLQIQIQLKAKAEELQAVVIEPYEKDGWATWGKFFTDNFIGNSFAATQCHIVNYQSLHFRHSKKKDLLTVVADEPLIVENKWLGYRLRYQLEGFSYDFKENILLYYGYTLFTELNAKGPKKWQLENRRTAYNGSIAHFMNSLYHNRLAEEGFEVKRLTKTLNLEKDRIKKLYRQNNLNQLPKDSLPYYERILKQPDMLEEYGKSFLTGDSLVTLVDSMSQRLFFNNYLYIVYKNEREDPDYLAFTHENRKPYFERSFVFLINKTPLTVESTGNYYMPQDLISYGYWGWSEKINSLLPLDYHLEEMKK